MDANNLYFVFENCKNGSLANLIDRKGKRVWATNFFLGRLDHEVCRIYAASLVVTISQMHSIFMVMHWDIKPENVLIHDDLHIKLIDFGEAKQIESDD
jgi:serine/threonine protein kinase